MVKSTLATLLTLCLIAFASLAFLPTPGHSASAYSPRHSGLEPPGGPRPVEALPGNSQGRMPDGGIGHVDAYGNPLGPYEEPEKEPRRRLRQGAYGARPRTQPESGRLPEPGKAGPPLWSFQ